jgi:hypothetical protein
MNPPPDPWSTTLPATGVTAQRVADGRSYPRWVVYRVVLLFIGALYVRFRRWPGG